MDKKALQEILAFDNGNNMPNSFYVWIYPEQVPEVAKLVFDLLLRFRHVENIETPVNFSEIEPFVARAIDLVSKEAARLMEKYSGVVSVRSHEGGLSWGAPGRSGDERPPTIEEVAWFEGESALLHRSVLGRSEFSETESRRLFAAFGLYSCGRAIRAMNQGDLRAAAQFLGTAGRCVGFSRVYFGWSMRSQVLRDERSRGGKRPRQENPEKALAQKLARENPTFSATQVKLRGRLRASERTIRKWLSEGS